MAIVTPARIEKPYSCKYNNCKTKGFANPGTKSRHEREQHGPGTKCDYCSFTAKRQYLMMNHMDVAHPGERVTSTANTSRGRPSRRPTGSGGSGQPAAYALQLPGGLDAQPTPTSQDSPPPFTFNSNNPQADAILGVGFNQHPPWPLYAPSMLHASLNSDHGTTARPLRRRRPSTTWGLYTTMCQRNNIWPYPGPNGVPFNASLPVRINHRHLTPATMNVPNYLNCICTVSNHFHPGSNNPDMCHTTFQSSSSYEQGIHYIGEMMQHCCCGGLPPTAN